MSFTVAKMLYKSGALLSCIVQEIGAGGYLLRFLLARSSPDSTDLVAYPKVNPRPPVELSKPLLLRRGGDRVFRSLNAAADVAKKIGFRSVLVQMGKEN